MLWFLENVAHEHIQILSFAVCLLELTRWTVADRRITKERIGAFLHVLIQFLLLLHQVLSQTSLLLLTFFKLGEIDAKVELLELSFASEFDSVELSWVVAPLFLDLETKIAFDKAV